MTNQPVTVTHNYTVTYENGCVFLFSYDSVPMDAVTGILSKCGQNAIMDLHLARLARAMLAAGPKDACRSLWTKYEDIERARVARDYPDMEPTAQEWLAVGQHGSSSAALFFHLTGVRPVYVRNKENPVDHPCDADDLSRCRLLLEQAPALASRFPEMKKISPVWARLVDHWDNLCALMDEEAPWRERGAWSTPQTNARLATIIAS